MADVAMGEAGAAVRARPGGPRTIRPLYKAMQLAAVCACARRVIVPCARARVALRHVEARPRHPTHARAGAAQEGTDHAAVGLPRYIE